MDNNLEKSRHEDSRAVFAAYCDGRSEAADEIFRRYLHRLTTFARARLGRTVGRRVDPDDAVQSAFRSFFIGARAGKFTIANGGDLWRLLASITAHKASRLTTKHQAAKRSVRRETSLELVQGDDSAPNPRAAIVDERVPLPDHAAILADELVHLMKELSPELREILELRLQDVAVDDIAAKLGCSARTVRRRLEQLRAILERRAEGGEARVLNADVVEKPVARRRAIVERVGYVAPATSLPTIDYRDWVIQLHIGSGGMGRVYRVQDRRAGDVAALKVLRKQFASHPGIVRRFREEAELVASLDHTGIVKLRGMGRMPGGSEFFVMDLVECGDLSRVPQDGLTGERIAAWLAQAACAVAYANARGIVHCDLKPSNLLLAHNERIVVADFGLAAALSLDRGAHGATPKFAAPESLLPEFGPITAATDVWGLGAVLAWLLCGVGPWPETVAESIERIKNGRGPDLPAVDTSDAMSAELVQIASRCLKLRPEDRYTDCRAVETKLKSLLGSEPGLE